MTTAAELEGSNRRAPKDKLSATCGRVGYQKLVDIYQSLELKKLQKES